MLKKYDVIVYIGRFQPAHNAHTQTIRLALELADRVVIIIGSSNEPRTYFKNPFVFDERAQMLQDCIHLNDRYRVDIVGIENQVYSDAQWAMRVTDAVQDRTQSSGLRIGKIGYKKDKTVEKVLNLFPTWEYIDTPQFQPLDATKIREVLFNDMSLSFLEGVCAPSTIHFLHEFRKTENYHQLMREKRYIEDYQKQFSGLAYAPTFVTADAVVFQSGYVLLVKRKAEPGKGLLALPGGFLNASTDESLEDAAIRELYEETSINLPEKVLRKNIKNVKVFDAISRSARGRTITHAYNIVLDDGEWNLPKIKGGDDAEEVGTDWYPINNLDRSELFEDHYDIIKFFIGKI